MFTTVLSDRFPILAQYAQPPRQVMDLGCVDARPQRNTVDQRIAKPNFLFKRTHEINPDVLGVDIDPQGIEQLQSQGYHAACADVETMDLQRQFDTIIAGEIIEHLENCGLFLRNLRRHLKPGGVLIISTPNPFYVGQTWKIWRYGKPMVHEDHLNWQDPTTLDALLRRTGYEPFDGYWIQPRRNFFKTWKHYLRPYFSSSYMRLARRVDR
ncbi:MAG: class I SAM-dependent methyltransferase [Phycisphaerales bacterium]|nr:class I SAM-dependent methyltransferase [Phycisphaerales bacterium]